MADAPGVFLIQVDKMLRGEPFKGQTKYKSCNLF